ncbi:MAG: hypothetical protein O2865_02675 [Planctomycetota bacterium]|nr:hypothetical protein [Planctomycetota bacterium]MDA0932606.1 hypothetical protein [Planctomycetota bacterium]MDA1220776.1 hypothetical protein [Planctomycetota bacterium]
MGARILNLAPTAVLTIGLWFALAHGVADDPRRTIGVLTLGCAVFAFLPAVMASAMGIVSTVLLAVLGPIAIAARVVTGRETGFGSLAHGMFDTAWAVVPGYVDALAKVRSLRVWGFVLGSYLALPALIFTLPTAP